MSVQQDVITTLEGIVTEARMQQQAETDLDARRTWLRLESAAEDLLVFYGQRRGMAAPTEEELREKVRAELVAAGWKEPETATADSGVKSSWWRNLLGGG